MAPTIGSLFEFDSEKETWEDYLERFEFYIEANKITEDNDKKCTLLTAIGAKTYETIKCLIAPAKAVDATYIEIIRKCNSHFGKPVNELLARVQKKRDQKPGKSLKDFERNLRELIRNCKFGADKLPTAIMLKDRFVAGILVS